MPSDRDGQLEALATSLLRATARLSGRLHPETRRAVAEVVRPMNSYYSNRIEGHDTHPLDIERAMRTDYADDASRRDRQIEARAHIEVHRWLSRAMDTADRLVPTRTDLLLEIHRRFYAELPASMHRAEHRGGGHLVVTPGAFRCEEVEVGRHKGPMARAVPSFMDRFTAFYDPTAPGNRSLVRRIMLIAASHHRFAWIHPFLDGNGRVARLMSDAQFMYEDMDANCLWSVTRGLARDRATYLDMLAAADSRRWNDHDGRGNLSDRGLADFCAFFLRTALDQVDYMTRILDLDAMNDRIGRYVERLGQQRGVRSEARFLLTDLHAKGRLTKQDAMRITNLSDKTLKDMVDGLKSMGMVRSEMRGRDMVYLPAYAVKSTPWLFPELYPSDREADLMREAMR